MPIHRDIDDVVEAVRNAKRRGKKCALLIGAGCSKSAGVPLAGEFVNIIKTEWPNAFARAKEKTYPHCMAELADGERRDLIGKYVDSAKINWAHLALAQLIKEEYVERVLTTNFDPLVLRACALVNVFPAVYDFAASQRFNPAYTPERAVFHLHGQHTGFVLLHTEKQVRKLSKSIAPLFEDAGRGRLWLVVGYSGENDPVFDHLARVNRFDQRLYWVGYKDSAPARHVSERVLGNERSAYFVKGHDADDFFALLAQRLGCFPPKFVERPFSHLSDMLDVVTPYTLPGQAGAIDVRSTARVLIQRAIKQLEEGPERATLLAQTYLLAGQFDQVLAMQSANTSPEVAHAVVWALTMQGNRLSTQAKTKSGAEADALFAQARQKYESALKIKPEFPEALNNWGNVISAQAKTKSGAEADALFTQAGQKYEAALKIKPDDPEVLSNWGAAISDQAKTKSGAEADALFTQAGQKYEGALKIKPDFPDALNNWAATLSAQAEMKSGAEADALFTQAGQKFEAALKIKPDFPDALNKWGATLFARAKTQSGAKADALFAYAGQKFEAALKIKPDFPDALNNWGATLSTQAKTKSGAQADALLAQAGQKFEAALKIKPDFPGALSNWGATISAQAQTKSGVEADVLFAQAGQKLEEALRIKPDFPDALNNWGATILAQAKTKSGAEADALLAQASQKFEAALKIKPDFPDALYNWGGAISTQAKTKSGAEADALFAQAGQKFEAALKIKPDSYEALNNWSVCLIEESRFKGGERSVELLDLAWEKCAKAESVAPGRGAYNLACICSLRRDEDGCRQWLEVCRAHGQLPSRDHLAKDPDLANVRAAVWFTDLLRETS